MDEKHYAIRRAFLIPLGIDAGLLIFFTVFNLFLRSPLYERVILAGLSVMVLFVWVECLERKVHIGPDVLKIKKFWRERVLNWTDITHVGCLTLRSRVYLLLTTKKGFYIISNAYQDFGKLVSDIISHLPSAEIEVEEEARKQGESPTRNISDLVAAWLAAFVLLSIIFLKTFS